MSKSTFTPEKVRELCNRFMDVKIDDEDNVITEWLEQNPIEPVFVGLTDEQVTQFIEKYNIHPLIGVHLKDWQKTQTFTHPEVKEVVGISDEQICELADYISGADYEHHFKSKSEVITEWLKTQTFAQPDPVVVGLSDEQVDSFARGYHCGESNISRLKSCFNKWLPTQTFTQPNYKADYDLIKKSCARCSDDVDALQKELEQLKSQQFTPNWDGAPCRADEATITLNWYRNGTRIEGKHLFREKRPKPTLKVEVGQVWKHKRKGTKYEVLGFIRTYVLGEWLDYVRYEEVNGNAEFSKSQDDFLAKFERV